jgi:hypothetical protein
MGRRHGELMARRALGEIELVRKPAEAWDYFGTLVDQPRWIFPSGPAQGHLGLAELYRRDGLHTEAEEHLTRARADSGTNASVTAIEARIGLAAVWCATGEAAAAAREARAVAKDPLAACNPLLRFYSELVIAYADPPHRSASFEAAENLLAEFSRRPEDQRVFEQQLSGADAGTDLSEIRIVHL